MTSREPTDILRAAIGEHGPVAIFAGFSGGHDSLVSTHWTMQHAPQMTDAPVRVLHINTGIGIEETRRYVRRTCADYDWSLWERHARDGEYEEFVRDYGFPGGGQHHRMYQRLKERVVRAVLREVKTHRMQRVMFVTGIYGAESSIRAGYKRAVSKVEAQVWVNPLYWKPASFFQQYRKAHRLPRNPVVEKYRHSGECLCGAFADGMERLRIQKFFPDAERRLQELEDMAQEHGHHWRWHEGPSDYADPDQLSMFAPLCHGCGKAA